MSNKLTNEEFLRRFYERYSEDYEPLDKYSGRNQKMRIRHHNCTYPTGEFIYNTTPNILFDKRRVHLCPFCTHNYKWDRDTFTEYMSYAYPNIECIDGFVDMETKMIFRCRICSGVFERSPFIFSSSKKCGCPYCSATNHRVLPGYNDMWTTHPDMAKYLKNPDDGHKYSTYTTTSLWWHCLECGFEYQRAPSKWVFDSHGHFKCPCCGDGVSYPEKFVFDLLRQLNIAFITQLTKTTFEWCESYRYDFYIPSINAIIETHGIQHYDHTTNWGYDSIAQHDTRKKELALNNDINHYIVIDCRYSNREYIENSIRQSQLSQLLNLNVVDFLHCDISATRNIMTSVCKDWSTGRFSITQLAEKYPVGVQCIKTYLKKGADLGICNYNVESNSIKSWELFMHRNCKPVYCIELDKMFDSRQHIKRELKFNLNISAIDNPHKKSGGYHWRSLTDDEWNFFRQKTLFHQPDPTKVIAS